MDMDELDVIDTKLVQEIETLERKWLFPSHKHDVTTRLNNLYNWGDEKFCSSTAALTFEAARQTLAELILRARETCNHQLLHRTTGVLSAVHESYHALCGLLGWSGLDTTVALSPEDTILLYTPSVDEDDCMVSLINYIFMWTRRFKLRHVKNAVYQQVRVDETLIKAWVPAKKLHGQVDVHTVELLCAYICQKSRNTDMWKKWLTVPSSVVYDKLSSCVDVEFPVLRRNRQWMAFKDGIYSVYKDVFFLHTDPAIPRDTVACVYHPVIFKQAYWGTDDQGIINDPLMDLSTPSFDSILDTQELCKNTRFWLMAMMGRCLHPAQELDNWQMTLFIVGRSCTGKSLLVELLQSIYEREDVYTIANDSKIVLSMTPEHFMWAAPEVKSDFSLVSFLSFHQYQCQH
jgi:hypothetical protein